MPRKRAGAPFFCHCFFAVSEYDQPFVFPSHFPPSIHEHPASLRPLLLEPAAEHVELIVMEDNKYIVYVSPEKEVNAGLWTLFAGATVLLSLRLWAKITRRHGVWWDDYILLATWVNTCAPLEFLVAKLIPSTDGPRCEQFSHFISIRYWIRASPGL